MISVRAHNPLMLLISGPLVASLLPRPWPTCTTMHHPSESSRRPNFLGRND
jgi:hypothetical protein